MLLFEVMKVFFSGWVCISIILIFFDLFSLIVLLVLMVIICIWMLVVVLNFGNRIFSRLEFLVFVVVVMWRLLVYVVVVIVSVM